MANPTLVIGGGLVGLAAAWALHRRAPERPLVLLEKEAAVGTHQSGRNSGVLHSGIYYRPGSLRARLCRAGAARMAAFCEAEGLPFLRCGKVIVATRPGELPRLAALADRARVHGLEARPLTPEGLAEQEPHAAGLAALLLPATGVVDYPAVARRLQAKLEAGGVAVRTGHEVTGLREGPEGVEVRGRGWSLLADRVITCGGLHADRLAALQAPPPLRILPFRGEYHLLTPEGAALVKGLIYPVPDPALPFLGVHLTRGVHGEVDAGPNAVPALAREGYSWREVSGRDLAEQLAYPGFWRLARAHARTGFYEMLRSCSEDLLLRDLRRLLPALEAHHLVPGPAGVRAQAVHPDGTLADDFVVHRVGRCLHVLNAPSPAATASLAIGDYLADQLEG